MSDTVPGLQRALEILLPKLDLWHKGLEANGPDQFDGTLRGMFRAQAHAVGAIRWELDKLADRSTGRRLGAEDSFGVRLEAVSTLRRKLKTIESPSSRDQLLKEIEAAERLADAALWEFAAE